MNERPSDVPAESLDSVFAGSPTDGDSAGADTVGPESPLRLYTPEQVGEMLQVPASWLRKKVSARSVPCTFVGKHLRFSAADIAAIIASGSTPATVRGLRGRRRVSP